MKATLTLKKVLTADDLYGDHIPSCVKDARLYVLSKLQAWAAYHEDRGYKIERIALDGDLYLKAMTEELSPERWRPCWRHEFSRPGEKRMLIHGLFIEKEPDLKAGEGTKADVG